MSLGRKCSWIFGRREWPLLWSDRRGAVAILVAVGLPMMIGFAGLGVETGLWYAKSWQVQAAADAAALSAGMEIAAGKSCEDYSIAALHSAAYNGFVPSNSSLPCPRSGGANCTSGTSYICVNSPPTSGPLTGDIEAAEVVVVQPQNAFLASLYAPAITIRTRSVAKVSAAGTACVFSLDSSNANAAIDIATNSGTTTLSGCWLTANSRHNNAILIGGSSTLIAESLWTVGSYRKSGGATTTFEQPPVTNAYAITDTYAGISASASGACTPFGPFARTASAPSLPLSLTITVNGNATNIRSGMTVADLTNPSAIASGTTVVSATQATGATVLVTLSRTTTGTVNLADTIQFTPATMSMTPGVVYCAPVSVSSGTLTLSPGTYYIDGHSSGVAFSVTGGTVTGNEVTIVLTCTTDCAANRAGRINISGGTVNLTAPLSPASTVPAGVLFYQDKNSNKVDTGQISTITFTSAGSGCGSSGSICLTGAVYTPNTQINISGATPATCTILIGKKINITGATTLTSTGCPVRYTPPSVISQGLTE